jgi:protein-S-isoprenylcysteine O-methyltransferase Ste14
VTIAVRGLGALLIVAGLPVLVGAFVRFVTEGLGTPAPVAPPERLVVGGLFRYVRNPMYVAVLAAILGQALLLWQSALLGYGLAAGLAMYAFVRLYEEPHLTEHFGDAYREYQRQVPGWWPRLRPWTPDG